MDHILLSLTHWWHMLTSRSYRHHVRQLNATPNDHLFPNPANTASLVGGQLVFGIHPETACANTHCAIHNPSHHHMATWPQHWRDDRKLMERLCTHHVGHPDPDHIAHLKRTFHSTADIAAATTHGCCGCCIPTHGEN